MTPSYTKHFRSPNSRSKPFNMIDILKCVCDQIGYFLNFINYLLRWVQNSMVQKQRFCTHLNK
jgi:hypothetical protein